MPMTRKINGADEATLRLAAQFANSCAYDLAEARGTLYPCPPNAVTDRARLKLADSDRNLTHVLAILNTALELAESCEGCGPDGKPGVIALKDGSMAPCPMCAPMREPQEEGLA